MVRALGVLTKKKITRTGRDPRASRKKKLSIINEKAYIYVIKTFYCVLPFFYLIFHYSCVIRSEF